MGTAERATGRSSSWKYYQRGVRLCLLQWKYYQRGVRLCLCSVSEAVVTGVFLLLLQGFSFTSCFFRTDAHTYREQDESCVQQLLSPNRQQPAELKTAKTAISEGTERKRCDR